MALDVTNFSAEVIKESNDLPIIVDFWAPWCGPCRTLSPILENIDTKSGGKYKITKVNIDNYPEIADKYNVRTIPNVKLFMNGQVVSEYSGRQTESSIVKWINANANNSPSNSSETGGSSNTAPAPSGFLAQISAMLKQMFGK